MEIIESDMIFGPFEPEQLFYLEKSPQYTNKLRDHGIKTCEFILCRDNTLYFIEAKKTCPKQITASCPQDKKKKYHEYIQEIATKMQHSLTLYSNILLQRYPTDNLPKGLREPNLSSLKIRLVLVVKEAEKEWLAPFHDVFRQILHDELTIWKIPNILIINEAMARSKGFIL